MLEQPEKVNRAQQAAEDQVRGDTMKDKIYISASEETKEYLKRRKALQNRVIFVDDLSDADYLLLETDGKIQVPSERFSDLFLAKSIGLKVRVLNRENLRRLENDMRRREKLHKQTQENLEQGLE